MKYQSQEYFEHNIMSVNKGALNIWTVTRKPGLLSFINKFVF